MGVIFVVAARAKVSSLRGGLPWTFGLRSKRPSKMGRSEFINLTAYHDRTGSPAQTGLCCSLKMGRGSSNSSRGQPFATRSRRSPERAAAARVQARCQTLYKYLANNMESLVDYGRRYRIGLPISSSRAEGSVDDIANARRGKRRRMRWSPRGAQRAAVTRAAALDGRLTVATRGC